MSLSKLFALLESSHSKVRRRFSRGNGMKSNTISMGIGLAAILGFGTLPCLADDVPPRHITVDADVKIGALRPLSGIQAIAGVDGMALYKAARIDLIRMDAVLESGE